MSEEMRMTHDQEERISELEASSASHAEQIADLKGLFEKIVLDTHSKGIVNLISEIAELRKKQTEMFNIRTDDLLGIRTQLNELKERFDVSTGLYCQKDRVLIKEVLREYMNYMKNFNPQSWVGVNKILTKLASGGEK